MSGIATIACLNLVSDEYCENMPDDSVTFSHSSTFRDLWLAETSVSSSVLIGRKLLTELNAKQEETMEMEKGILDEFNVNGEFLIEFPNYDG